MKYALIRNTHLLLGLLPLPFLIVYGVSAVRMVHPSLAVDQPSVSESIVVLPPGLDSPRGVAAELMAEGYVRGELDTTQLTPAGCKLRVVRPGTASIADYDRGTGTVTLRTTVQTPGAVLNRLHNSAGIWHSYWATIGWTILVAVVSLALIGLGLSGIWMWFMRRQDRVIGIVLLSVNLGIGLLLLFRIRG